MDEKLEASERKNQLNFARQEHRLLSALTGLLRAAFVTRPFDREVLFAYSQAVLWCLVPGPATVGVTAVGLLGLLIALQANRVMTLQTDRMEEQNILAEAQRRASLVFESTSLFEQIQREKDELLLIPDDGRSCELKNTPCWNGDRFRPSRATMGRLAALTQALRPYRYLDVEGTDEPCDSVDRAPAPAQIINAFSAAYLRDNLALGDVQARRLIQREISTFSRPAKSVFTRLKDFLLSVGAPIADSARLTCRPISPERGQLLVSLFAADVDLAVLTTLGATFSLAEVPDHVDLAGIDLSDVDLGGARLRYANLYGAVMDGTNLRGADLDGAKLVNARILDSNLAGVLVQELGKRRYSRLQLVDAPPLFLMPSIFNTNNLDGLWLRYASPSDGFGSVCNSLELSPTLQPLQDYWLVEVLGSSVAADGAALALPEVLDLKRTEPGEAARLSVQQGAVEVSVYALKDCGR
ncbi:MAG: pentapeptide repeat-containing protein [Pseudomonadota bacterium]